MSAMNHITMKQLPDDERPYEKCLKCGAGVLSDAELLAVILRTGAKGMTSVELAREILSFPKPQPGLSGLYHLSASALCDIKGVGKVKAVQIQCITELSRRIAKSVASEGNTFTSAQAIADYYMEDFLHLQQERVFLLSFDTKGELLSEKTISVGTVNQSCVSPREIFLEALSCRAVYVILLHNHPSGNPQPSPEDRLLTMRVHESGKLLEIPLMDHIILGDRRYFSFREEGFIK